MAATVYAAALNGIDADLITIETRISPGIGYFIVGLPGESVKESLYRVESAIDSAGLHMPRQKILICMAPAGLRKEGAAFDLPIAVSILAESGQLTASLEHTVFVGELSLNGRLRPVRGIIAIALKARGCGFAKIIVPNENGSEAAMVSGIDVFAFETFGEVIAFLENPSAQPVQPAGHSNNGKAMKYAGDFADIRGQYKIKRAMEIAAAGGHNLLMIGPPGSGKTMMARRLPTIMPELTSDEALETTKIYSVCNKLEDGLVSERPFRTPHHTASDIAMVGGGLPVMPGEISLAHNGMLFLDELPEFQKRVLEALRQPLEAKTITISRASYNAELPANFLLVAAMNPCPCGYFGHSTRKCSCSLTLIQRYLRKISGPLLDRIDLQVKVQPVANEDLMLAGDGERSEAIAKRVIAARCIQWTRQGSINTSLVPEQLKQHCKLSLADRDILQEAIQKHQLSARSYDRILKLARTIADLAGATDICLPHLSEAISLRCLDQDYFQ